MAGSPSAYEFDRAGPPLLQTVKHQLDSRRHSELVENSEKIVAHDLLLAAGWTAKRVAITCYLLTALLAGLGWLAIQGDAKRIALVAITAGVALLSAAVWLGSLRSVPREPRSQRVQI